MRWVKTLLPVLAAAGLASCAPENPRAARIGAMTGVAERGRVLFERDCAECHQANGMHAAAAWYPKRAFLSVILDGVPKTKMRSFAHYSDQDVADVYAYLEGYRP